MIARLQSMLSHTMSCVPVVVARVVAIVVAIVVDDGFSR